MEQRIFNAPEKSWIRVVSVWRSVTLFLVLHLFATSCSAESRPEGLLWNRSGLPATLPLQIKTKPGLDHLVELLAADSAEPLLGAFIRGGEFFRVLVPPGSYWILISSGMRWRGEFERFGSDTRYILLQPPLTFRATDTVRQGHLIDLRDPNRATVREYGVCQTYVLDPLSLRGLRQSDDVPELLVEVQQDSVLGLSRRRYSVHSRFCD